jgi:hypothetical protein
MKPAIRGVAILLFAFYLNSVFHVLQIDTIAGDHTKWVLSKLPWCEAAEKSVAESKTQYHKATEAVETCEGAALFVDCSKERMTADTAKARLETAKKAWCLAS